MNKKIINLICAFIPNKTKRHNFRKKYIEKKNNAINYNNNYINNDLERVNNFIEYAEKQIIKNYKFVENNFNILDFNFNEDILIKELKKIEPFYFYPNNGNLGDILIANTEFEFFKRNNIKYQVFNPDDEYNENINLVYGGGGLFVKYWGYEKQLNVFKRKNIKNIIILPSSFFECNDLINIIDDRFTIFCREEKSFKYIQSKNLKGKLFLDHDMVFYSKNNEENNNFEINKNILYKNYQEYSKLIFDNIYKDYLKIYKNVITMFDNITQINGKKIGFFIRTDAESNTIWDTSIKSTIDLSLCGCGNAFDPGLVKILSNIFISAINCVDVVVTDRLHIGIEGTLLKKEVYLVDNSYGKVSNVYKHSMKDINTTHLLDHNSNIVEEIKNNIVNIKSTANNKNLLNYNLSFTAFLSEYINIINNFDFINKKIMW